MTNNDFNDDPEFVDFETPEYEPYKDDEVPAAQMPDNDDIHDVVLMTNMLALRSEFQLVIRSGLERSCGASVSLIGI
jgi:hypothetical protein